MLFEIGHQQRAHGVAGLVGGAALVGGEDDIVEGEEFGGNLGLLLEDVERGAAEAATDEEFDHGGLIDQGAAGDVDDAAFGAKGFEHLP
ncbi:hypothetical protein D3C72_2343240 [compost metagenome]